jgi:hypothetical protein
VNDLARHGGRPQSAPWSPLQAAGRSSTAARPSSSAADTWTATGAGRGEPRAGSGVLPAILGLTLLAACHTGAPSRAAPVAPLAAPQETFWRSLSDLCGQAFGGGVVNSNAADSTFVRSTLRIHVRQCTDSEIRIPFHVGANHSRTWVVTRTPAGLRLSHEQRRPNGKEERVSGYGGPSRGVGAAERQYFSADTQSVRILPSSRGTLWTLELLPGQRLAYEVRREGTDRYLRVEFDVARPMATLPPAPWGAER